MNDAPRFRSGQVVVWSSRPESQDVARLIAKFRKSIGDGPFYVDRVHDAISARSRTRIQSIELRRKSDLSPVRYTPEHKKRPTRQFSSSYFELYIPPKK